MPPLEIPPLRILQDRPGLPPTLRTGKSECTTCPTINADAIPDLPVRQIAGDLRDCPERRRLSLGSVTKKTWSPAAGASWTSGQVTKPTAIMTNLSDKIGHWQAGSDQCNAENDIEAMSIRFHHAGTVPGTAPQRNYQYVLEKMSTILAGRNRTDCAILISFVPV